MPTANTSGKEAPEVRKGQGNVKLSREESARRLGRDVARRLLSSRARPLALPRPGP